MRPWWSGANLLLRLSFGATREPGEQDITSHVMIEQLAMVYEGRNFWQAHAAKPDLQAMLMRSRVAESESLCALDGLGNFTVLEWQK